MRSAAKYCSACLLFCLFAVNAAASDFQSVYTSVDLKNCSVDAKAQGEGTFGGSWICEGYDGMPVYVAEGDLRMFVSFGANARTERAAEQTLPNFNTINTTLEWRLRKKGSNWSPAATILRWFPDLSEGGPTREGQVLIVTQILPGNTCQIARVNALTNSDANTLARNAADSLAGTVDCGSAEPIVLGNP